MNYSIVSSFQNQVEFALKVKEYLDGLLEIKTDNFSAEMENDTYFIEFEYQGIKITVPFVFKDVYEYVLRKGIDNARYMIDIEDYINHLLQAEIANTIN